MPVPNNSGMLATDGGWVRIQFPGFNVDMSCDNETELSSCIEMLKKGLELFEVSKAKKLLLQEVILAEQNKLLKKMTMAPPPVSPMYTTGVTTDNTGIKY